MKTGIIDVGGGLRGIYGAGVFDRCFDDHLCFDYCIGVSAGSANIASFLAGQRGRNKLFYTEYAFRKQYMGLGNRIRKGSYIDLDYVYGTLSNSDGESPLDYRAIVENPTRMQVVATEAMSGKIRYFDKNDLKQDEYGIFKASSALPVVCRPYVFEKVAYFDGALSDPVPVEKAFAEGCDRVILILTRPRDVVRSSEKDIRLSRWLGRYPESARALCRRAERYNAGVALARKREAEGRLCIIAPDDISGVDTLTKDKTALLKLYEKGYGNAAGIASFLES